MSRGFKIPSIFTAVDKVSGTIGRIGANIENFSNNAQAAVARAERRYRKFGDTAEKVAKKAALVGAAILAPLGLAANEAIKFEDNMADVAKVMNLTIGSDEFKAVGNDAKQLGIYLARSATESAALMASLAQGGVVKEDINEVARIAGRVGVAFDVAADVAGDHFIKMKNALGATIQETAAVTDAINYLSDNTASKAQQILTFMASGGAGVARAMNASGEGVAALGAQLIAMGKEGSEAGTIIERFSKGIMNNAGMKKIFDQAGGGMEGMMAILERGSNLNPDQQFAFFQKFGQYGTDIRLLAQNYDQLTNTVSRATDVTQTAGSVQAEFENRQQTTAVKLARLKTQIQTLAIEVGDKLIPVIQRIAEKVGPLVTSLIEWAQNNPGLVKTIVFVAAGLGILSLAISGVAFLMGIWAKAMIVVNALLLANPIGLIIIGIVALIALITAVIKYWNDWGAAVSLFLGPLGAIINLIQSFRRNWDMIVQSFKEGGILSGLKAIGATLLDAVLMPLQQLINLIAKIPGMDWAKAGATAIGELRANLGVNTETDESGNPLPEVQAANPRAAQTEALREEINRNVQHNLVVTHNDPSGRTKASLDGSLIPNLTPTFGL